MVIAHCIKNNTISVYGYFLYFWIVTIYRIPDGTAANINLALCAIELKFGTRALDTPYTNLETECSRLPLAPSHEGENSPQHAYSIIH